MTNPFESLIDQVANTIKVEEFYLRRFERYRRIDILVAVGLLALGTFVVYMGNWLGWVYLVIGTGMIGMAFHAQFCILRTQHWLNGWRADLTLFQLGSIEWENGEFAEWIIREAEARGRYRFIP